MSTDETSIESTDENATEDTEKAKRARKSFPGTPRNGEVIMLNPLPSSRGGQVDVIGLDTEDGPEHLLYSITPRNRTPDPELVADIKANGVKQPIKARKNGPIAELIIGHRRIVALRAANEELLAEGKDTWPLPTLLVKLTDTQILDLMLSENSQRKDEVPSEKARLAQKLLDMGWPKERVATSCGLRSTVALDKQQQLLDLDPYVLGLVDLGQKNGGLSADAALNLVVLKFPEQVLNAKEMLKDQAEGGPKATARTAKARANPDATIRPTKKEANRLIAFLKKEAKLPKKDRYFDIGGPEGMDPAEFAHRIAGVLVGEYKQNRIKGLTAVLKGEKTHDKKEDEEE